MKTKMSIDPAQEELDHVFGSTFSLLGRLSTFYSVASLGLSRGADKQFRELYDMHEEMYKRGELAKFFGGSNIPKEYLDFIRDRWPKVRQNIENQTRSAIDAGCIVFAHSILDASVYGYLRVTALTSPESWQCYVDKKKVELESYKTQSYEEIRNRKIQHFLESNVERESLLYKLDLLHKIAPPKGGMRLNKDYVYDRKRLSELDDVRHKIVHGNDWSFYSLDLTNELFYWDLLNWYFLGLVANKTGLKLSPKFFEFISGYDQENL